MKATWLDFDSDYSKDVLSHDLRELADVALASLKTISRRYGQPVADAADRCHADMVKEIAKNVLEDEELSSPEKTFLMTSIGVDLLVTVVGAIEAAKFSDELDAFGRNDG